VCLCVWRLRLLMRRRGCAHPPVGGTLDKLEAIPGFRTQLTLAELAAQMKDTHVVIAGASPEIAPADRALYALVGARAGRGTAAFRTRARARRPPAGLFRTRGCRVLASPGRLPSRGVAPPQRPQLAPMSDAPLLSHRHRVLLPTVRGMMQRDVTGTVESQGLICASIISKKLCEDLDALVLDVKVRVRVWVRGRGRAEVLDYVAGWG
jgi:hypothetical protein